MCNSCLREYQVVSFTHSYFLIQKCCLYIKFLSCSFSSPPRREDVNVKVHCLPPIPLASNTKKGGGDFKKSKSKQTSNKNSKINRAKNTKTKPNSPTTHKHTHKHKCRICVVLCWSILLDIESVFLCMFDILLEEIDFPFLIKYYF